MPLPPDQEAVFEEVVRLRDAGRFQEALFTLEPLLKLFPEHAGLFVFQGHLRWELEKLDDAERSFRRAAELKPALELASLALYHCLWLQGKQLEACDEMERFLKIADSQEYREIIREINDID